MDLRRCNLMQTTVRRQPDQYADCPRFVRDYLFYLQTIKGRSERTVQGYYVDLRTFFRFLLLYKGIVAADTPFSEISISGISLELLNDVTLSDLYEFLNYVMTDRENHAATRSRKVSCLRSFFHYLNQKSMLLDHDPTLELEVPSLKKSLPKYLTLEQCLNLLKSVDGPFRERDFCMITLFLNCGMRLSELVGINLSDINTEKNQIRLLGKGNKERMIYLNHACVDAISVYLEYRNSHTIAPTDRSALFLTNSGHRIGTRRVQQIIDHCLKTAGLEEYGFSTHKLRHTAATIMYQYGDVDIRVLQKILGHANLGTTEIYTHVSDRQMKQAADQTPLAHVEPTRMLSAAQRKDPEPAEAEDETHRQ